MYALVETGNYYDELNADHKVLVDEMSGRIPVMAEAREGLQTACWQ